jgi:hypothetical protein
MKKLAYFLIALTASSLAVAEGEMWNQHTGSYMELNVGTNAYYAGILSSRGAVGGGGMVGVGWSGALGYNFTPAFALEAGFMQNFVDFNLNHGNLNTPYATTKLTVPLGDRFSFIGKIGAMAPQAAILLPFTGVGVSYAMTKNVDFNLQYQGAVYGIAGAGLAGVGFTYHFG